MHHIQCVLHQQMLPHNNPQLIDPNLYVSYLQIITLYGNQNVGMFVFLSTFPINTIIHNPTEFIPMKVAPITIKHMSSNQGLGHYKLILFQV
jgi:hypothetical protein